jgi:hypothetical protein
LEDELLSFTTAGFVGQGSPDAGGMIWALTEIFPKVVSSTANTSAGNMTNWNSRPKYVSGSSPAFNRWRRRK